MILRKIRIIALCVAVALLLSGCGSLLTALTDMYWGGNVVKFADMEYSRPMMSCWHISLLCQMCWCLLAL